MVQFHADNHLQLKGLMEIFVQAMAGYDGGKLPS